MEIFNFPLRNVVVFRCHCAAQVSSSTLGKKRESVSCGMQNNQGSPCPLCVLWHRCENSPCSGIFWKEEMHLAHGVLPFTSFLSPAPFPDRRYVGWQTRVIAESTACLKTSQFFTHLTKKKPLPKPEILQPAQFWHQYLNIQGRMSHFSEVVNNPKFRLNEEPNILYLGTSRKLKSGSSLSCLEGKKTNIRVLLNTRNHQVWQTTVEPNC